MSAKVWNNIGKAFQALGCKTALVRFGPNSCQYRFYGGYLSYRCLYQDQYDVCTRLDFKAGDRTAGFKDATS